MQSVGMGGQEVNELFANDTELVADSSDKL